MGKLALLSVALIFLGVSAAGFYSKASRAYNKYIEYTQQHPSNIPIDVDLDNDGTSEGVAIHKEHYGNYELRITSADNSTSLVRFNVPPATAYVKDHNGDNCPDIIYGGFPRHLGLGFDKSTYVGINNGKGKFPEFTLLGNEK